MRIDQAWQYHRLAKIHHLPLGREPVMPRLDSRDSARRDNYRAVLHRRRGNRQHNTCPNYHTPASRYRAASWRRFFPCEASVWLRALYLL